MPHALKTGHKSLRMLVTIFTWPLNSPIFRLPRVNLATTDRAGSLGDVVFPAASIFSAHLSSRHGATLRMLSETDTSREFAKRQVSDDVFLRPRFFSNVGRKLAHRHTHVPTSVTCAHFGSCRSVPDWDEQRGMGPRHALIMDVWVLAKVHVHTYWVSSPIACACATQAPRERMLLSLILPIAL